MITITIDGQTYHFKWTGDLKSAVSKAAKAAATAHLKNQNTQVELILPQPQTTANDAASKKTPVK